MFFEVEDAFIHIDLKTGLYNGKQILEPKK